MDELIRRVELEREEGAPSGQFNMTLATDGEASDGHILSMEGAQLEASLPMLFSHRSTPEIPQLGRIDNIKVAKHAIRGQGNVLMSGADENDPLAATRRGIAHMIDQRVITDMSVRWEPTEEPVYRTELPPEHPAHVSGKKAKGPRRYGMFFPKWRGIEGSVVATGADNKAKIGRMAEDEEDVIARLFFRGMSHEGDDNEGDAAQAIIGLREHVQRLRDAGVGEVSDFINAVSTLSGLEANERFHEFRFGEGRTRSVFLPRDAYIELVDLGMTAWREALRLTLADEPVEDLPSSEPQVVTPARTRLGDLSATELIAMIRQESSDAAGSAARATINQLLGRTES